MTDELFTIHDSKPDPLTAARNRMEKLRESLDEMLENRTVEGDDYREISRQFRLTRETAERLETAAMKSR